MNKLKRVAKVLKSAESANVKPESFLGEDSKSQIQDSILEPTL
jgi:hypothetical protein